MQRDERTEWLLSPRFGKYLRRQASTESPVFGSLDGQLIACHRVSALRLVPGVVLVIVKEAGNLLLQLYGVTRLANGTGVVEKLPLDGSRQVVPLHDHGRPEALQDMLLIPCERCSLVAIALRVWERRASLDLPAGEGSSQLLAGIPALCFYVGHV
jgi:hypothetical protein